MRPQSGYYRHPTLHGDRVLFVCEDDLWAVPTDGGVARRLTSSQTQLSTPRFSPDGGRVAYAARDEGPTDIYVMDAEGGAARRLTWLGVMSHAVGWTPDGKGVMFATAWRQMMPGLLHLATVPVEGGVVTPLRWGPARAVAHQPKGKGVVIGRNAWDPARWKRYRGGTAGTLWVDRDGKGDFEPLVEFEGNLAGPMWIGSRVYFLSDHEGHGNLYSVTPTGRGLKRHTHHEDFYVRFPSTDGRRIVYHAGGDLHLLDPRTDENRRIEVRIQSPRTGARRRFVDAARFLESYALHPEGNAAVAVSRGGAYAFGLWDGPVVRHGESSAERRRLASWLSDGKRIASITDAKGEEALVVEPGLEDGKPREVARAFGRALELAPSPAGGQRIALTNHRQELWLVDVQKGTKKKIDASDFDRIQDPAWSPDGRYLAYSFPSNLRVRCIRIYDTTTGRKHDVTRAEFQDWSPSFDPEGRYLYFVSARVFDPVYDSHYFDLGFPRGALPCLVTLRKDLPSPFESAGRDPRLPVGVEPVGPKGGGKDAKDGKKEKDGGDKPSPVKIDFDGIEGRVVSFPVGEERYGSIAGAPGRVLFGHRPVRGSMLPEDDDGGATEANVTLQAWIFEEEKAETVADDLVGFSLSGDGRALALRTKDRVRVVPSSAKASDLASRSGGGRAGGWIQFDRIRPEVHPGAEWKQMFREAWRLQRDHFWTSDMSGVAWKAIHDRYLPLVERVATRAEFSDLVWEMQGELGTSHCYEMGGDYRQVPAWYQGFLGVDLEYRPRTRSWHVARIPQGDSWEASHVAPIAAPGVNVKIGDRIEAIDGREIGADRTPYECLVNRAGRAVRLRVRTGQGRPRDVVVRAAGGDHGLRYRDWVETNRSWVHEKSKGKVGYVHIPNMGPDGFAEFHRYYRLEVEREGLLVDVRFNGGGHVSQLLLEKLLRRRIGYDTTRWGKRPMSYPDVAPMGPMVALINEYAGSDGDIFSQAFKLYDLGPLVGTRTWGGVVGIWPRHALVDGTMTSQPEFSFWFEGIGWGVENYGVAPDIEVDVRPQDYAAGVDPQLERALKEVRTIIAEKRPTLPDFGKRPQRKPPKLPPVK